MKSAPPSHPFPLKRPESLSPKGRLVVGVSGGSDSVALLYLLHRCFSRPSESLLVAHVNYGLRGRSSDMDERLVRRLCRGLRVPLKVSRWKDAKARARREGMSLQDWARRARYAFFARLSRQRKAWGVAVAHHRQDQAETVLDRLLRGAGPRGLTGLREVQELSFTPGGQVRVWRPLLPFSKEDLVRFLGERGVPWREDLSNRDGTYRRNRIRREVIPFLARWNPRIVETLAKTGEIAAAEEECLEGMLALGSVPLRGRLTRDVFEADARAFARLPLALQRRWIRGGLARLHPSARGLSFERLEDARQVFAGSKKGPRDLGSGLSADRSKDKVRFLFKPLGKSTAPRRKRP